MGALNNHINPFTAVYKCTLYAGGKYGYVDVTMVIHIVSYKIITNCRDIHLFFSCLFETFGSMSEIMFSSDNVSKTYFFNS